MTTVPNLPPLPAPDIVDPGRFGPVYIVSTVESIQLTAYAAGRDAAIKAEPMEIYDQGVADGLDAAAQLCERDGTFYTGMAERIRDLKSEEKGGVCQALRGSVIDHFVKHPKLWESNYLMRRPTGRDLYMKAAHKRDQSIAVYSLNGKPSTAWCELDDIEQAAWNEKAKESS